MEYDIEVSVVFKEDHPTLEGHFPGNPLIPGVVILNQVIKSAKKAWPQKAVDAPLQVVSCKFLNPLIPPAIMTIHLKKMDSNKIKFTTKNDALELSSGVIELS